MFTRDALQPAVDCRPDRILTGSITALDGVRYEARRQTVSGALLEDGRVANEHKRHVLAVGERVQLVRHEIERGPPFVRPEVCAILAIDEHVAGQELLCELCPSLPSPVAALDAFIVRLVATTICECAIVAHRRPRK